MAGSCSSQQLWFLTRKNHVFVITKILEIFFFSNFDADSLRRAKILLGQFYCSIVGKFHSSYICNLQPTCESVNAHMDCNYVHAVYLFSRET